MRALGEEEVARHARAPGTAVTPNCSACCCRAIRATSATSFSRSAPAPAATRPRSSPATCCACTAATPKRRAGRSRRSARVPASTAAIARSSAASSAAACSPRLKFESGTHRVQRVPATEAQGRIHTSAVTVAILPELDEIDKVRDQSGRPAHRHLPLLRRRRPARQQDRLGRAHHAPAQRHRGGMPGRALAAQEPLARDGAAVRAPAGRRTGEAAQRRRRSRASCRSAAAIAPSASAPTIFRRAG